VLAIDLDHFKDINDTLGHHIGDSLIGVVAQRLVNAVRHEDLVARLGGDEFAVLQSTRSGEDVDRLSDRIQLALSTPFMVEGAPVTIGVSIGRAAYPAQADDADTLMRTADAAMFDVKHGLRAEVAPQHPAQRP
jgi:diguanylate cyclase (GGDEF)-like protein